MTDLIVCDLDGVIYLGDSAVPGAGEALSELTGDGYDVVFCTNNSWRTPEQVAAKIERLTGFPASVHQILTSAMAAARMVEKTPVLVCGGEGIGHALLGRGLVITEDPREAKSVVVGLDTSFDYDRLVAASAAIRGGADFIATNLDATYPTDAGLLPGAGSIVAALETATGRKAIPAGKPFPPMRRLLSEMAGGRRVWVVGDRIDTDLAMAYLEGWKSVLVLTGVTEDGDGPERHPDLVLESIADLPKALSTA